jgi:hypothetical protein
MSKLTDDIREWASQPWIGPVLEEAMQAWAREVAELERAAALVAGPEARFGVVRILDGGMAVYEGGLVEDDAGECYGGEVAEVRWSVRKVLELDRYDPPADPADLEVPA